MFRNRGETPNINTGSGDHGPKGYSREFDTSHKELLHYQLG